MAENIIRNGESTIKDAIEKLLSDYKVKTKLQEAQLVNHWESIVGKLINRHTTSLYIKHNKLYLKLDSAVVKQELMYARTQIRDKVNENLNENIIEEVILI